VIGIQEYFYVTAVCTKVKAAIFDIHVSFNNHLISNREDKSVLLWCYYAITYLKLTCSPVITEPKVKVTESSASFVAMGIIALRKIKGSRLKRSLAKEVVSRYSL